MRKNFGEKTWAYPMPVFIVAAYGKDGSVINGAFQNADLIDELSLVTAPLTASADGKPLFWNGSIADFDLISIESNDGTSVVRYKRKSI